MEQLSTKRKSDLLLVSLFVLLAFAIILKSYFDTNGYLSSDSTNYLKLAQNLLEGRGYYTTPCDYSVNKKTEFFAIWPIGYPTMIFLLAKLFSISVFWASKLLNVIFLLSGILILRRLFKENAYIYAGIFLFADYLEIYSYTWSEAPFILGLVWFVYSIYCYVGKESNLRAINIFISALFLFFVRYIGGISFAFLGILSVYYFVKGKYSISIKLLALSAVGMGTVCLYLYHNYLQTGFFTGLLYTASPQSNSEFLKGLLATHLYESNLLIARTSMKLLFYVTYIFQWALLIFFSLRSRHNFIRVKRENGILWRIIFSVGVSYWICIIVSMKMRGFESFNVRYFAPSTFLFLLALVAFLEGNFSGALVKNFRKVFLIIAIVSFFLNFPVKILKSYVMDGKGSYYDNIKTINAKYQVIPKDSMVILGNNHLNYLRTDIRIMYPVSFPRRERLNELVERVRELAYGHIYFEIGKQNLDGAKVDETFDVFFKNNQGKVFVKLR